VTTDRGDEVRQGATGTPAPFTPDQVAKLVRGTLSEDAVAIVLNAFPAHSARKRDRSTKQSPVSLSEKELRRLTEDGVTPADVNKRLKAAVSKEAAIAREPADVGERPTKRPPKMARAK
jgi:hypothetical protein